MAEAGEAQPSSGMTLAGGPAEVSPPDGVVVRLVDGTVADETPFAGGAIDGEAKIYGAEGWLRRVARFKAGQLAGETVEYDADGNVVARFTFAGGRLNGPASVFVNGRVSQQMHYVDAMLSGEMRSYDAAGALVSVSHFVHGHLDGESTALRLDGSPIRVAHYRKGQLDGEVAEYWDNGKIRQRAQYKDNVLNGPTVTYLMTGEPDQNIIYDNGKPVANRPLTQPQDAPAGPVNWLDRLISGT